jgi:hypothetical protein
MIYKSFYIPIHSTSLAIYFGNACISPGKYYTNKIKDIQDKFPDYILLSDKLCDINSDCCLEVILNDTEIDALNKIQDNLYLLNKPLPISRVKFIYFNNQQQLEYTITNINLATAFIPDRLLKIVDKFEKVNIDNIESPKIEIIYNWQDEIKYYDSILGGFALMKNSGEDYMNFSEKYFSTLSFFNSIIENELVSLDKKIEDEYFDVFLGKGSFRKLFTLLKKEIDEDELNNIAKEENQIIVKDRFTKIIDLSNLKNTTLISAILYSYGVGEESRKKRIDGLILSNFKSDLPSDKSEIIALSYGINRGYSIFQNKYKLGEKEKFIKFRLDNKLDYYTIESIYQFAFNKIKSERYEYIENIKFDTTTKIPANKNTDYFILDTLVFGKKKPKVGSKEYLSNLLHSYFQKNSASFFFSLFENIISIIKKDVVEEINDENHLKDTENSIKKELEAKNLEIERLNKLINDLSNNQTGSNLVEDNKNYLNKKEDNARIEIIKLVKTYLKKDKLGLENEAREKGLIYKNKNKDELIILLLSNNKQEIKFQ